MIETPEAQLHVAHAVRSLLGVVLLASVAMFAIRILPAPSPYVELGAGPTVGLSKTGSISLTTVESTRLSWGGYWIAKLAGQGNNLVPWTTVDSPLDNALNTEAMAQAKRNAAVLAVYAVTGKMPTRYSGAKVVYTVAGDPAAIAGVQAGDIIETIGAVTPTSLHEVSTLIHAAHGGLVTLGIVRGAAQISVTLHEVAYKGSWRVGVGITPVETVAPSELPPPPSTGSIEGPSGGLMFTLSYISELSPGALSNEAIAGTGTIDSVGGVGDIGGVNYKVAGAIASGAKVFFSPSANYSAARAAAGGKIEVVSVNSIGDALKWLCQHGSKSQVCHSPGLYQRLATLLRPA